MKNRLNERSIPARESTRLMQSLVFLLLVVVSCLSNGACATDRAESLALLVETLAANVGEPNVCNAMMRGMLSGLEGRRNVEPPPGWSELSEKLSASHDVSVRELSSKLSQIFGDRKAMLRSLALVKDRSADVNRRRSAFQSLLEQQSPQILDIFESLLDEQTLALDAIRGCSNVANAAAPAILINRYEQFNPELRRAVIETLASRKEYAEALLEALKQKKVARDDIPVHIARTLNEILGQRFVEFFGAVRPIAADREQMIAKFKAMITDQAIAEANASRGRAIFQKTCAACHLLYGEGGKVGPDLTGSNRANLDYILLNSVDPSYDVPEGYRTQQILTVDGRVITGVLAEEDAIRVVLKTAEQPRVVVAKEDIETRKVSPKSMMPDGQLDQMKPQEVLDLIKYLRTTKQVELAK